MIGCLRTIAFADGKVQSFIDSHEVVKVIVVPQRLVKGRGEIYLTTVASKKATNPAAALQKSVLGRLRSVTTGGGVSKNNTNVAKTPRPEARGKPSHT